MRGGKGSFVSEEKRRIPHVLINSRRRADNGGRPEHHNRISHSLHFLWLAALPPSFCSVLGERYVSEDAPLLAPNDKFEGCFARTKSGRGKQVEFFGERKIRSRQQVGDITKVSLRGLGVSHAGDDTKQINTQAGHLTEVDLQGNMLWDWEEVMKIMCEIPNLEAVHLNGNRLRNPSDPKPQTMEKKTGEGFVHHRGSVVLAHELQKVSSAPHTVAEHLPAARKGLVAPVLRFLEKKLADQGMGASDVQRPAPQAAQAQATEQLNLMRGPTGGVGLGISRAERSGPFVVRQLVPGSAVEQSKRMQMGDQLHEVSGVSVHDQSLDQVKALILGQPGTVLSLKYYSPTPEERAEIMARENGEAARMSAGAQRPAQQAAQAQEAPSPERKVPPRRRSWIMGPHRAGIGLTLTEPELRVVDVVAGGAAHAIAGFAEVGDVLVSVDGVNVAGMSLVELGKLIVGDEGTAVAITLAKGGTGEHKSALLSRRTPRNSMSKRSNLDG